MTSHGNPVGKQLRPNQRINTGPMRFRKRPVMIEAMQYTEANREALIAWCGAQGTSIDDDGGEYELLNLRVKTKEGVMMCSPNDWVIRGVQGEFYPCKPDIFQATYDLVEDK